MNLYLVTRIDNWGYDEFDSFVVAAKTTEEAANIHPYYELHDPRYVDPPRDNYDHVWTTPENIQVKYIGKAAKEYTEVQIICASFNAG